MTVQNSMMVQNSGVLAPLLLVKSAEGTLGGGWVMLNPFSCLLLLFFFGRLFFPDTLSSHFLTHFPDTLS